MKPFPHREMSPINSKIAERLNHFQEESHISISAMAKLLCLEKGTYHSYLRGKALPPIPVAENILRLYKNNSFLDLEWLYYGHIDEYIKDFLIHKGHNDLLNIFPSIPKFIYLEYDIDNCGPDPREEVTLSDQEILFYFKKVKDMLIEKM